MTFNLDGCYFSNFDIVCKVPRELIYIKEVATIETICRPAVGSVNFVKICISLMINRILRVNLFTTCVSMLDASNLIVILQRFV